MSFVGAPRRTPYTAPPSVAGQVAVMDCPGRMAGPSALSDSTNASEIGGGSTGHSSTVDDAMYIAKAPGTSSSQSQAAPSTNVGVRQTQTVATLQEASSAASELLPQSINNSQTNGQGHAGEGPENNIRRTPYLQSEGTTAATAPDNRATNGRPQCASPEKETTTKVLNPYGVTCGPPSGVAPFCPRDPPEQVQVHPQPPQQTAQGTSTSAASIATGKEKEKTDISQQRFPSKRTNETLYEQNNEEGRSGATHTQECSPASKRPAFSPGSCVEVTYKVLLPSDFYKKSDNKFQEDDTNTEGALAKLGKLFAETGGEEEMDLYEMTINPNHQSTWHARMPYRRDPPPYPLERDNQQPPRRRRELSPSVVSDVHVDTRYYGKSGEGNRLRRQRQRMIDDLGPIDQARFRDYSLLPVDFFVAPFEYKNESISAQKTGKIGQASPGRRRRGRSRKPRDPMSPVQRRRETQKSKESKPSEASVRVGRRYQAKVPPRPMLDYERDEYIPG